MINLPERMSPDTEMLHKLRSGLLSDLRVAAPGIIKSFDAAKQTVTVQVAIRERVNLDGKLSWKDIPILVDVPVCMPRAGGYVLTLPVQAGNECLVVFGDNCMDAWWQSGGVQNQIDMRRHDLSDGYALLGVWSQPRVIPGYSANSAQLRNDAGTVVIEVAGAAVNVTAPSVNVTGSETVNVSGNGNTVIEDKVFLAHQHTGVEPGGGTTGGVA